eukprot:1159282-Pelagomonas_calceolata.AAC.3
MQQERLRIDKAGRVSVMVSSEIVTQPKVLEHHFLSWLATDNQEPCTYEPGPRMLISRGTPAAKVRKAAVAAAAYHSIFSSFSFKPEFSNFIKMYNAWVEFESMCSELNRALYLG